MISPYDAKNNLIQFKTKFNLPTYYGSRDNNENIQCGLLSNIKRNLIIKQHSYKTNGVGLKPIANHVEQIAYNPKNSIRIKNIVYKIPNRFCTYIPLIRELLEQNISFPTILKKIAEDFNIIDPNLSNIQPSILKNKYRHPNFNTAYKTYNNVANFSAPFKMGNLWIEGIGNPQLLDFLFPVADQIRYVYVVCNDGINYTNNVDDLRTDGIASFWGAKLSLNGENLVNNTRIPVIVFPIDDVRNLMFGSFYTTIPTPPLNPQSKLIYIPITTVQNFPIVKDYYAGMNFNVRTYDCYQNVLVDYTKLKCKYSQNIKLYANT